MTQNIRQNLNEGDVTVSPDFSLEAPGSHESLPLYTCIYRLHPVSFWLIVSVDIFSGARSIQKPVRSSWTVIPCKTIFNFPFYLRFNLTGYSLRYKSGLSSFWFALWSAIQHVHVIVLSACPCFCYKNWVCI